MLYPSPIIAPLGSGFTFVLLVTCVTDIVAL
jgi:hypothetical protein